MKQLLNLWYRLAALFVVLSIVGCPAPAVTPVVPDDVPGKCSAMCSKLRDPDINCPEGQPSELGTTCESSCEQIYALGYLWPENDESSGPVCILKAPDLSAVRACNVRCVGR